MQKLVLSKPVVIEGRNIYGRMSKITFSPLPSYCAPGWYWKRNDGTMFMIRPEHCSTARRRVTLVSGSTTLNIFEHIGYLWWMGLRSLVVEGEGWPPFDGGANFYYEKLLPSTHPSGAQKTGLVTVKETVEWFSPDRPGSGVSIEPAKKPQLEIFVNCDYKGLGAFKRLLVLPSGGAELLGICQTNTIGFPHYLHPFGKLPWFAGKINWRANLDDDEFRKRILDHRLQDLLGALSLLCSAKSVFVGTVRSYSAGHKADIEAVKLAAPQLTCL